MNDTIFTLVPSSNRGRYALNGPQEGRDLTAGDHLALLLGGQWIRGHIAHSSRYDGSGCYAIADAGLRRAMTRPHLTQEGFAASLEAASKAGQSPGDALAAATGQVVDLFCSYYFIASDGSVCGLCTGMQVRLL